MIALVLQVIFTFRQINYFEIGGIVVAILMSTLVSTISEHRSEQAFDKLRENNEGGEVSVLRDDKICCKCYARNQDFIHERNRKHL